jgi:hypothetical protein
MRADIESLPEAAQPQEGCMNRRILVFGSLVCLALVAAVPPAVAQEQPNILVVWGDDVG